MTRIDIARMKLVRVAVSGAAMRSWLVTDYAAILQIPRSRRVIRLSVEECALRRQQQWWQCVKSWYFVIVVEVLNIRKTDIFSTVHPQILP